MAEAQGKTESKTITLYVPTNIKTHFEFVDGVSMKEALVIIAVTGVTIALCMVYDAIYHDVFREIFVIGIVFFTTFFAVKKNEINKSIIDMLRLYFIFSSTQQKYKYEYKHKFTGGEK
jgi:hypothetical protein